MDKLVVVYGFENEGKIYFTPFTIHTTDNDIQKTSLMSLRQIRESGADCLQNTIITQDSILCKSIRTHLPVYAAPCIIEEIEIDKILNKKREYERTHVESLRKIDDFAMIKGTVVCWQIALYNPNGMQFEVGYESEGDENGDGR